MWDRNKLPCLHHWCFWLMSLATVSVFRILAMWDNSLPVQQATLLFNNTQFPPYKKGVRFPACDFLFSHASYFANKLTGQPVPSPGLKISHAFLSALVCFCSGHESSWPDVPTGLPGGGGQTSGAIKRTPQVTPEVWVSPGMASRAPPATQPQSAHASQPTLHVSQTNAYFCIKNWDFCGYLLCNYS